MMMNRQPDIAMDAYQKLRSQIKQNAEVNEEDENNMSVAGSPAVPPQPPLLAQYEATKEEDDEVNDTLMTEEEGESESFHYKKYLISQLEARGIGLSAFDFQCLSQSQLDVMLQMAVTYDEDDATTTTSTSNDTPLFGGSSPSAKKLLTSRNLVAAVMYPCTSGEGSLSCHALGCFAY
jgi:hypothetical protein